MRATIKESAAAEIYCRLLSLYAHIFDCKCDPSKWLHPNLTHGFKSSNSSEADIYTAYRGYTEIFINAQNKERKLHIGLYVLARKKRLTKQKNRQNKPAKFSPKKRLTEQ